MMPLVELRYLLSRSVSPGTSVNPDQWSSENPFFGHCAVCALLVKDYLGGSIRRVLLPHEWANRLGYASHYWNVLPNGQRVDLSRDQFPPDFPYDGLVEGQVGEYADKFDNYEYILSNAGTKERYLTLDMRIQGLLTENPLFQDEKFQRCWELAFSEEVVCRRMRFGCVVYARGKQMQVRVAEGANYLMTKQFGKSRFCALDGSRCGRDDLRVGHRQNSEIGDCMHAIVGCIPQLWKAGLSVDSLAQFDFYEAGFYPDGNPWWREEPSYTCVFCENIFAVFGLQRVWFPFAGQWYKSLTSESFYSSVDYALGTKEI